MHLQLVGHWQSTYPKAFEAVEAELRKIDVGSVEYDDGYNIHSQFLGIYIPEIEGFYTSLVYDLDNHMIRFDVYRIADHQAVADSKQDNAADQPLISQGFI